MILFVLDFFNAFFNRPVSVIDKRREIKHLVTECNQHANLVFSYILLPGPVFSSKVTLEDAMVT